LLFLDEPHGLPSRRVQVAGITPHPTAAFMQQCARQLAGPFDGFLLGKRYLLHDRDTKFTQAFDGLLKGSGVGPIVLPARSPNVNVYAERWVRSIKEECLTWLILFGEASLRHVLTQYVEHFHHERNHQGKGNVLLFPAVSHDTEHKGQIRRRERLGGLLKYYTREAA
jgi:putative transposase